MDGMNRDAIVRGHRPSSPSVRPSRARMHSIVARRSSPSRASRVDDASRERARARGPWTRRATTNHES